MSRLTLVVNTRNPEFVTRMMLGSTRLCYKSKRGLFVPTLALIACFIDGAGDGSRPQYIKNLKDHFPNLCAELGALCFYKNYRSGAVHNFSMKPGFGIHRGGKRGEYVVKDKDLISINIDRLFLDFTNWIKGICKKVNAPVKLK